MEALGSHRRNFVVGSHTTGDFSDGAVVPIQCLGAKNDWLAGSRHLLTGCLLRPVNWRDFPCTLEKITSSRWLQRWLLSRVAFQAGHSDGQQRGGRG